MAGPANPFAVIQNQRDGMTGPAGRGRGGESTRPTPNQANVSSTPRDPNYRGRARGTGRGSRGRGRGRGSGPVNNTWRKPESNPAASSSPSHALKQNRPPTSSFGQPSQPMQVMSSPGVALASPFASRSHFDGTSIDSSRDPRKLPVSRASSGTSTHGNGSSVPVENASTMGSYNDRYERLKVQRAKERESAIRDGQMADPNQPTNLNQAITPVGTCTSMCPEFERVERIVQKMVDKSEKFLHPATNNLQTMELKMLKRFRRSAAGYDEQLPSDIRTPGTLLQTMNYLIRHVLGGPEPLGLIHKFVWDRTRSIRNDLSVQQVTQEDDVRMAVTCLERIARFHIMSLHLLSNPANEEPFDRHQEREQLNNTMLSLMYYYDDNRDRVNFPNENEFRAYYIVFSIHDQRPDLEARVQKWPAELRNSPQVQLALELLATAGNTWEYQGTLDAKRPNAIAQGFYARFFSLVDSPAASYLLACVAEIYFNHLRQTAIRSIWKGYCRYPASQQHKNEEWTVDELTKVLYLDDDNQTLKFCEEQDLQFAQNQNGDLFLNWGSRSVDSVAFQPSSEHAFSEKFVESKRAGRSPVAIVLGLNIKEASELGMIDSSLLPERTLALPSTVGVAADDNALFVSDEGNIYPPSCMQSNGILGQEGTPLESPFSSSFEHNVFGMPSPATIGNISDAAAIFSQPPNVPQSSHTSEMPSSASLNPFAPSFSPPVESVQPSLTTNGLTTAPPSQPLKPSLSPFAPSSEQSKGSPFSPTPPNNEQHSIFSTESSNEQPISVFAPISNTSTAQVENNDPSTTAPPPTLPSATTTWASPFSSSTNSPTSPFNQTEVSPTKPASSIFDSLKTPNLPTTGSIFSPPVSNEKPSESPTQPQEPAQPMTSNISSIFQVAPEKDVSASLFQPTPDSLFPRPVVPEGSTKPDASQKSTPQDQTKELVENGKNLEMTSVKPPFIDDAESQVFPPVPKEASLPEFGVFSASASTPTEPGVTLETSSLSVEQIANDHELKPSDAGEEHALWIKSLKEAAEKRRRTISVSRKRPLNEGEAIIESGAKPSKVSKPEAPPRRKKTSMALSSIKPLPTLPILEQVRSMISRKPAAGLKPETPTPNQVDEDELLLSAARIAAESLRRGPKIWDGYSTTPDTRRSSFSPRNIDTSGPYSPRNSHSSVQFSRSMSPQSSAAGHDLALAPGSDLGLGRSLSRTEQRLRLTGGKGLAYKPLDFTPKKSRKSK
ncbi:hypothetical protein FE257_009030 [Aspergillus nanangensis]|uniref:SAC3/GANP/THP3 conserved domain-containing protein n=1 Tax=Aspergillus nanangensis TaxID=2582783 RepID=A0AAD4GYJ2_ASPNN|nr:hypothetical protein FE257_009030 [Aspergillus nanangensis]